LLLAACAALQIVLLIAFVVDTAGDSFLLDVWLMFILVGAASFTLASSCVWRGLRGSRVSAWLVALISVPFCGTIGNNAVNIIDSLDSPSSMASTSIRGLTVADFTITITIGLSALALGSALIFLMLPSSNAYFRTVHRDRLHDAQSTDATRQPN
jgi:hypothetical protein